jgi:hypothetical protein
MPQTEFEQLMLGLRLIKRDLDVKLTITLMLTAANFGAALVIVAHLPR